MKVIVRSFFLILFSLGIVAPVFSSISVNLYGKATLPFGNYSNYVATNLGGGVGAEFGDLLIPNLGLSVHADFLAGVLKDDRVQSMWNMAFYGGVWYRFQWGDYAFQPEFNYGINLHSVTMDPLWRGPENVNVDQMIQFVPAFRWTPRSNNHGKASLDVAPFYTMIFEKSNLIHQIGLKLGIVYLFDF